MWWKLASQFCPETARLFRSYQPAVLVNDIVLHNSPCTWDAWEVGNIPKPKV